MRQACLYQCEPKTSNPADPRPPNAQIDDFFSVRVDLALTNCAGGARWSGQTAYLPELVRQTARIMSDEHIPLVFIIIGEVRKAGETNMIPFNALLAAPDDDTAVRHCLEALAQEGYEEADLHQIGNLDGRPDEDPYVSAYDAALEGEVAIIAYESGYDFHNPTIPN